MPRILGLTTRAKRCATLAALLGAGLLLSACGQKGPLFLPAASTPSAKPAVIEAEAVTKTPPVNANIGR